MNLDVNLQDPIRNFAYEQILPAMQSPLIAPRVLDIGVRDSGFAAYLAQQGYQVTAIDREDFSSPQDNWKKRLSTEFTFKCIDFLSSDLQEPVDIVTSVYALQHNVAGDTECYRKCAKLATKQIFITNEFNYEKTLLHLGRNDGDMRIYSMEDVQNRIIAPIQSVKPWDITTIFSKFKFETQQVSPATQQDANSITLMFSSK